MQGLRDCMRQAETERICLYSWLDEATAQLEKNSGEHSDGEDSTIPVTYRATSQSG